MSSDLHTRPSHFGGIAAMLAATTVFAAMDSTAKLLMADYSVVQVLFFRAAFGLLPLLPLLWRSGLGGLATRRPLAHVLRSAVGLAAVACFFLAIQSLPLARVTVIGFGAPLLITALSVPALKEHVDARRWLAVAAGFSGVLIMAGTDAWTGGGWPMGAAFALAGTILYALVMVMMRAMGRTESALATVFWFSALTLIVTGAALPLVWHTPDLRAWALFAAVGILGGAGQLLITQAVRLAPASVVAPFDYFHIVASSSLGWLIFAEPLAPSTILGAMVVVASGLYVLREERRRSQKPGHLPL